MTQQHPITPPPSLKEQWRAAASNVPATLSTDSGGRLDYIDFIATRAAQWGADQELEACCEWIAAYPWLDHPELLIKQLRAARRPNPPSLKEQALDALAHIATGPNPTAFLDCQDIIRRALEQLDD